MKTYTTRSNARRAAKQQLGQDIVEGQDYRIIEVDGKFGFEAIDTPDKVEERQADSAMRGKSVVENPTNLVWQIAASMPGARRRDVIAACVDAGIAFYTARTQYQKWYTAQKQA